jgi:hypothetical protein
VSSKLALVEEYCPGPLGTKLPCGCTAIWYPDTAVAGAVHWKFAPVVVIPETVGFVGLSRQPSHCINKLYPIVGDCTFEDITMI